MRAFTIPRSLLGHAPRKNSDRTILRDIYAIISFPKEFNPILGHWAGNDDNCGGKGESLFG